MQKGAKLPMRFLVYEKGLFIKLNRNVAKIILLDGTELCRTVRTPINGAKIRAKYE